MSRLLGGPAGEILLYELTARQEHARVSCGKWLNGGGMEGRKGGGGEIRSVVLHFHEIQPC